MVRKRSARAEKIEKTTIITSQIKATETIPYRKCAKL